MGWVAWGIVVIMMLILIGLFADIVIRHKKLDAPCAGVLIVDREKDPDGFCSVYLQVGVDPSTFKEGDIVKLRVKSIIFDDSQ